jgi:hypothetical protein
MGSTAEISKENIITAMMEELTEEERPAHLVLQEHVQKQFLKGFKKDRGGFVKRVEEFVLPSIKMNNNQVEEVPPVSTQPSNLMQRLSLMMDQKVHAAQIAGGDVLAKMNNDIDALKRKKTRRCIMFIKS